MGKLADAVATTLAALELSDADQAAAELARQLADEIDSAERNERVAERALYLAEQSDSVELEDLIRTLRAKASHRDAIVRVGQRLEAVLVQLQATPAARGKAASSTAPFVGGALSVLRGGAG